MAKTPMTAPKAIPPIAPVLRPCPLDAEVVEEEEVEDARPAVFEEVVDATRLEEVAAVAAAAAAEEVLGSLAFVVVAATPAAVVAASTGGDRISSHRVAGVDGKEREAHQLARQLW